LFEAGKGHLYGLPDPGAGHYYRLLDPGTGDLYGLLDPGTGDLRGAAQGLETPLEGLTRRKPGGPSRDRSAMPSAAVDHNPEHRSRRGQDCTHPGRPAKCHVHGVVTPVGPNKA
jgi:hypothetical protein